MNQVTDVIYRRINKMIQGYICFEHTTYLLVFSRQFGPYFYRIECGEEIEVEFEFDDNHEPISNKFLWDIFETWRHTK